VHNLEEDVMSERLISATVGDIVAADFRAAGVFEQFGIDFCCGGRRLLPDACRSATVDPADVIRALDALPPSGGSDDDAATWPLDALIGHIVTTHHGYVRTAMPLITRYLAKLEEVHGVRHPELTLMRQSFAKMRADLDQHMMKEEQVLFPYIAELAARADDGQQAPSPFGTVANPILMMEREHRAAADDLHTIRALSGGYSAPEDGCTTYAVCMAELARFENDLHRHVHLENNVLFPAAIRLESHS
jgi:regulator of cell morphogenesis and NO signaling